MLWDPNFENPYNLRNLTFHFEFELSTSLQKPYKFIAPRVLQIETDDLIYKEKQWYFVTIIVQTYCEKKLL